MKDYGDKLVRGINKFVQDEGLQEFVQSKRKRLKTTPKNDVIMLDDGEFDEFESNIDFNAIDIP
jgi:hypothetical protein